MSEVSARDRKVTLSFSSSARASSAHVCRSKSSPSVAASSEVNSRERNQAMGQEFAVSLR